MTISTLAFGKANALGSRRLSRRAIRLYATNPAHAAAAKNSPHPNNKSADAASQRDLFVNILNANATRRDAKQYLARFKDTSTPAHRTSATADSRVNLGSLSASPRAITENPQFVRQNVDEKATITSHHTLHVALVLLRAPQTVDDRTLDGVALTLSQLIQLDMRILVVLDCGQSSQPSQATLANAQQASQLFAKQAARLSSAIAAHSYGGARPVNGAIEVNLASANRNNPPMTVSMPNLLFGPLERTVVPVIPTLAHTPSGQLVQCSASGIMSALTHLLSGLADVSSASPGIGERRTSLDRIIILDGIGGIPSQAREDDAHVFINLDQEFDDIAVELAKHERSGANGSSSRLSPQTYRRHLSNLEVVRECLKLLPSASSALIITPEEAASSSQTADSTETTIGAGTRRQKNPLIHNLLTNKPMVSSSLPAARIPSTIQYGDSADAIGKATHATLVKRGMPLTIIPTALRGEGWQMPPTGKTMLDLETDPRVDLPRLVHLIEDSFRRKLDLQHYLARIRDRTAGLIVAGSYEGAAILTWEQPPRTTDPSQLVPYLDKFAVLSSSQGSAGVADFLFQSMVRTCFPHGVCWRSRKDNPVNKWYFERAEGHWRIPGTNWTMFWTGAGVVEKKERWEDYVSVCSSVEASWKDSKRPD